jgi:hypothetical protein
VPAGYEPSGRQLLQQFGDLSILRINPTHALFGVSGVSAEGDSQDIHPVDIVFCSHTFYLSNYFLIMVCGFHFQPLLCLAPQMNI